MKDVTTMIERVAAGEPVEEVLRECVEPGWAVQEAADRDYDKVTVVLCCPGEDGCFKAMIPDEALANRLSADPLVAQLLNNEFSSVDELRTAVTELFPNASTEEI